MKLAGIFCLLILILNSSVSAQQIDAKINFHLDKLSLEEKDFLADLDAKLERATESYHWEGAKRSYLLPINYDLFWDKSSRSGSVHNYSAGLLVSLESGIALRDKRTEFRYSSDDWIHFGEPYEPLSGILEFYTWICLGFDADRNSPLGGNPFYQQARMVGERARSEAQFSLGWDDRRRVVLELTDSLYVPVRRARFHTAAGFYYVKAGNELQAKNNLNKAVKLLTESKWKHSALKIEDHVLKFVDTDLLMKSLKDMGMDDQEYILEGWIKNEQSSE